MKFKNLNESHVSEDKYREFILAMMGEAKNNKFIGGIMNDGCLMAGDREFTSFERAKEWCEKTLKKDYADNDYSAYISLPYGIDNVQTEVCLCYNGEKWYFITER